MSNHNHFTNIQVYSLYVAWNLSYHISYADLTADKLILIISIIRVQSVKVNCRICYYCVVHPKHFLNMLQVRQFLYLFNYSTLLRKPFIEIIIQNESQKIYARIWEKLNQRRRKKKIKSTNIATILNIHILTYDTELSICPDCLVEPCWTNLALVFCVII